MTLHVDSLARLPTRGSTIGRRALVALAVVLGVVVGPAAAAFAHAELESASPSDQAVVATSPGELTLTFTERVAVQGDGVRVLDASGERVDEGTAKASDATVTVPVADGLGDGGYVVAWRVVSADGHPVKGAFQFFIGTRTDLDAGLVDEAFAASADKRDEVVGAVLRGLAYLGALAAGGATLMGAALRRDDEPSPVGRVVGALSALGLAALLLNLPVQSALATGRGWGSVAETGVLKITLSDGVGLSIAVTGVGLLAMLITMRLPFRGAVRNIAVVGAALAPLGFAITGHTRTMSPSLLAYLADVAHLVAAAIWFGGLAALLKVVGLRRRRHDSAGAAAAVARFSGWAGLTLLAVAVAGSALGWIEVRSIHALTSTTYGQLLMAKVAVVALIALAAGWNRFRLVPSVMSPEADPSPAGDGSDGTSSVQPEVVHDDLHWRRLLTVVRFEVVGIVAALALTSVLVNVTPARTSVVSGPVTASAPLGEGTVEVVVDPARPGRNDVHAYLLDERGAVDDSYEAADFSLAMPERDIPAIAREPVRVGPGHFQLVATDLTLAGTWTLTVTVRPDRFTEQTATVTFRIS